MVNGNVDMINRLLFFSYRKLMINGNLSLSKNREETDLLLQNVWPDRRVMSVVEIHGATVCFGQYNTQKQRLPQIMCMLRSVRSALHIQIPE